jgi:hypothetical protein
VLDHRDCGKVVCPGREEVDRHAPILRETVLGRYGAGGVEKVRVSELRVTQ